MEAYTMPESEITQTNQSEANNKKKRRSRAWLWWATGGVLVVAGLLIASYFAKDGADRAQFLASSFLSAFVLAAVIVQAVIYHQQRKIMAQQIENARISERAYIGIEKVATESYEVGATHPVVRVTVVNGGRTPAYNLKMPGHLTVTRAELPYPHERPESSDKATESFLPSGHKTTFSYPFFAPLVPWTAQWAQAINSKEYFVYLHIEAQFVDAWGDQHVRSFKLFYRVSDKRWAEYKDPKDTEPIVEVT
jgi:hypothetical protein